MAAPNDVDSNQRLAPGLTARRGAVERLSIRPGPEAEVLKLAFLRSDLRKEQRAGQLQAVGPAISRYLNYLIFESELGR